MLRGFRVQGYLAHKKLPPPRTLQQAYAKGHIVILGGWTLFRGEIPLHMGGCIPVRIRGLD